MNWVCIAYFNIFFFIRYHFDTFFVICLQLFRCMISGYELRAGSNAPVGNRGGVHKKN